MRLALGKWSVITTLVCAGAIALPSAPAASAHTLSRRAHVATLSSKQYATSLKKLLAVYQTATAAFQNANASGSLSALAQSSHTFATANTAFANGLSKLSPPANVAKAQTLLVAVIRDFATDLNQLGDDAAADNKAGIKAVLAKIQALQPKLKKATQAIIA